MFKINVRPFFVILITFIIGSVCTHDIFAQYVQPKFIFRGGIAPAAPIGSFASKDNAKVGIGVNLEGHYFIFRDVAVGLSTGFNYMRGRTYEDSISPTKRNNRNTNFMVIPVCVSGQYHFIEKHEDILTPDPYVGVDLGAYIRLNGTKTTEFDTVGEREIVTKDYKPQIGFGIAPHVGVSVLFSRHLGIYVEAKYHFMVGKGLSMMFTPNAGIVCRF